MTLDEYFDAGEKTPAELATEVGLTVSSLSRIRRGKQNITRDVILRLIDGTGGKVTAEELLGLHDRSVTSTDIGASPDNGGDLIGPNDGSPGAGGRTITGGEAEADSPGPFPISCATCSPTSAPSPSSRDSEACSITGDAEVRAA